MPRPKSPGLFKESLENISRNLFRDHSDTITALIGNSPGIYALYDENELYYVGRASDLKRRVNQHLRDRHDAQWTHFSLFLIHKERFIGDIEALLIRIAEPVGNRVKPKRKDSKILLRRLTALIKEKQKEELRQLTSGRNQKTKKTKVKGKRTLKGLVSKRTPIYNTYKGKEYKATLTPLGKIIFRGKAYTTPTAAALAIINRKSAGGWNFWRIKNSSGEYVRLADLL